MFTGLFGLLEILITMGYVSTPHLLCFLTLNHIISSQQYTVSIFLFFLSNLFVALKRPELLKSYSAGVWPPLPGWLYKSDLSLRVGFQMWDWALQVSCCGTGLPRVAVGKGWGRGGGEGARSLSCRINCNPCSAGRHYVTSFISAGSPGFHHVA